MVLTKYLNQIAKIKETSTGELLYRGQAKSSWELTSCATRRLSNTELDLFGRDFFDEYIRYHNYILQMEEKIVPFGTNESNLSALQRLAKLQHFGVATGLLDFTFNPLIAIWFAVSDEHSSDGRILILEESLPVSDTISTNQENESGLDKIFEYKDLPNYKIWEPPAVGDAALRILSQRSIFVIGMCKLRRRILSTLLLRQWTNRH